MQKKNQGANDDALADAEEVQEDGGNKEPFHSASYSSVASALILVNELRVADELAVAVAGSVNGLSKELSKEEDHQVGSLLQ